MSELGASRLQFVDHDPSLSIIDPIAPDLTLVADHDQAPIVAGLTFMHKTISRSTPASEPTHSSETLESTVDVHSNSPFTVSLDQLKPLMKSAPTRNTQIQPSAEVIPTQTTIGQRVRQAMGRARKIVGEAPLKGFVAAQNMLTGAAEQGDRRKAASIVAGTLALGFLALQSKGLIEHGHIHEVVSSAPTPSPRHTDTFSHMYDHVANNHAHAQHASAAHEHLKTAHEHLKTVTIKPGSGDTISHEAANYLHKTGHAHTTVAQRVHEMHRIMQLNHISEQEALKLGSTGDVKLKLK